ncbi:metalloregulator ArsR/SmtB family transcription factor [Devosia sp.]|uniref:ArsR/SmtB family transcription factor n=1 Tax=Devosia sp. TaxID=1871048 RepID=UPI001AD34108|nr:winged helix-turn-helix transcriptional regulator [Devosia sp.]
MPGRSSEPSRRAILVHLLAGEATVSELVQHLQLSQSTVSSHLDTLDSAQLVIRGRDAQRRPTRLNPKGFKALAAWLGQFEAVLAPMGN